MITAKQMTIEDNKLENGKMKHMFLLVSLILVTGVALQAGATPSYQDTVLADGPSFYWTFDEASGNAVNYGSEGSGTSNVNDLVVGAAALRGTGTETPGGGALGTAAIFSGAANDTWVSGLLTGGEFSKYVIECWIRHNGVATYVMQHGGTGANNPSILVNFWGYNDAFILFGTGAATEPTTAPTITGDNTTWHHVVVGVDSTGSHIFYVDGVFHSTDSANISSWAANLPIYLGSSYAGVNRFEGAIDEFAVYDVGAGDLSTITADIADHYNYPPPAPGTLIYGK